MKVSPRIFFFLATGIGIGGFAMGQILEIFHILKGCYFCFLERILCLIGGTFSFLAWVWWPNRIAYWSAYGAMSTWIVGLVLSVYHTGIQYGIFNTPFFCQSPQTEDLESFLRTPSCNERTMDLFSLPFVLYLSFLFLILIFFGILCVKKSTYVQQNS